jgi:hypothetical protein
MPKEWNWNELGSSHITFKTQNGKEYNGYVRYNIFYNDKETLAFMPFDVTHWKYKEKIN